LLGRGYTLRRRSDRIACAVREAGGSHHVLMSTVTRFILAIVFECVMP